jgi:hypothetical protein
MIHGSLRVGFVVGDMDGKGKWYGILIEDEILL